MGGMISQELAYFEPKRFKTVTLLCTCAKFRSPPKTLWQISNQYYELIFPPKTIDDRIRSVSSRLFPEDWLEKHDERYPEFKTNFDRFYTKMKPILEISGPTSFGTIFGQGLACLTHHMSPTRLSVLGKYVKNIIVITGTSDSLIDYKCSEELSKGLNCDLILLENRGHGLLEDSEYNLKEIIERQISTI